MLQVIAPSMGHFMTCNLQHCCNRIAGAARLAYSSSTITAIVRRRLTCLVILDGEIKAAPSAMLQVVGFVEQYATAPKTARRRLPGNLVSFQSSWRRRSIGLRPNRLPDVANSMAAIIPPDACGCNLSKSDDRSARRRGNGNSSVETSCRAI